MGSKLFRVADPANWSQLFEMIKPAVLAPPEVCPVAVTRDRPEAEAVGMVTAVAGSAPVEVAVTVARVVTGWVARVSATDSPDW